MPNESVVNPTVMMLNFIPYILIFLVFYFLFFKPQKDEKKKLKEMLANLKKNDDVVTLGGIHGTIVNVKDTTVIIRVDDNVKIEFDREAITKVNKN